MGNRSDGRSAIAFDVLSRHRTAAFSVLLGAVVLAGIVAGAPALGGGGPPGTAAAQTDGSVTEIESCTVIETPGTYELTADVDGSGESCIHVRSNDVVVDGNGHAVVGEGPEHGAGVLVFNGSSDATLRDGPTLRNVTVQNLTVSDWGRGVQFGQTLDGGPAATLQDVSATGNGLGVALYGADESTLNGTNASDNDGTGVMLWETDNVTATGLTLDDNGATGLSFADGAINSTVSDVNASANDGDGIHFSSATLYNRVTNATVTDNAGAGVVFSDSSENVVRESTVSGNDGPGVVSDPAGDDRVVDVTVTDNEVAYVNRFSGVTLGVVAERLRLGSGVVASFDANVSEFDGVDDVPDLPRDVETAGPAANVSFNDEADAAATATVTFPVDDAVDDESHVTVVRYDDGEWQPVTDNRVDTANGTITATVGESGVVVPVRDVGGTVVGSEGSFEVASDERGEDFAYGFLVDGTVEASGADNDDGADNVHVERRADGTTVVLGTTDDGADTFLVDGDVLRFESYPQGSPVSVELDGEDVTDRLVDETGR